jgi:hypothetical protein
MAGFETSTHGRFSGDHRGDYKQKVNQAAADVKAETEKP